MFAVVFGVCDAVVNVGNYLLYALVRHLALTGRWKLSLVKMEQIFITHTVGYCIFCPAIKYED